MAGFLLEIEYWEVVDLEVKEEQAWKVLVMGVEVEVSG